MNKSIIKLDKINHRKRRKQEMKELKMENKRRRILADPKKLKIWNANTPPRRSLLEEVGNAITHGVGAAIAILLLILMLIRSSNSYAYVSAAIYGGCLFVMMLSSCLYHAFGSKSKVKRIFRRFDYSSIYLLIGGTFTPLFLLDIGGTLGIVLCILQWSLILFGITFVAIFGPGRFSWLHFTLYFIIGWAFGMLFIYDWIVNQLNLLTWILLGGIIYTLGMIPFALKNVKSAHFIWHFFVIFGALIQWLGIYLYVF